jgi:hypothetical protein
MAATRIPDYAEKSFDGMLFWFAEMSNRGLLFHPDEDPADMIHVAEDRPLFTVDEADSVRNILTDMFDSFEDQVYEACYPIFMNAWGIPLDA